MSKKILVVGAGFSGAVIARLLAENGYFVHVIDCRDHLGGNAFDFMDSNGIRIHKYGPHIFHTSNMEVVSWLSQFTEWIEYKHRVKAMLSDGRLVTLPVNKETSSIVGRENVLDIFFRPYTRKMWDLELDELDPSVLARVPIREDLNEYYFPNDTFQALPLNGYAAMFERILSHEKITVSLNTGYEKIMNHNYFHVFNSMAIDEYFDYCFGRLPYRSIKFHTVMLPVPRLFDVANINFTHDGPYTRLTEWKNFPAHGENPCCTVVTYEEPCNDFDNNFDRYYPVKDISGVNRKTYERYRALVSDDMTFIGRCGMYVYVDMHQAVSVALAQAKSFLRSV